MKDQEFGFPDLPEITSPGDEFAPAGTAYQEKKKKKKLSAFGTGSIMMGMLAATVSVTVLSGAGDVSSGEAVSYDTGIETDSGISADAEGYEFTDVTGNESIDTAEE